MQLVVGFDDRADVLLKTNRYLRRHLGPPPTYVRLDPVCQLVMSLIGGRTRSDVSRMAFLRLQQQYGTWSMVRDAPVSEIRKTISAVTFSQVKAARLQATLRKISDSRNQPSLDQLRPMTVREAHIWLERLPGVGRKVSAAVLNFSKLRKCTLVIDTHHLRILRRLGFVSARANTVQAYECVMPLFPDTWRAEDYDGHHTLMKRHGQTVCRHANPLCERCVLRLLCPSAQIFA